MQHDNPWQHINSETVYKDEWVEVIRDSVIRPDAKTGSYTYLENEDSVMIIAINDNSEIYLEWTYRYPVKSWGWELPGGGVQNDDSLESAKVELLEEAGFIGESWELLGKNSTYNGLVTGYTHYFRTSNLKPTVRKTSDDNEITNTGKFFKKQEIKEMIKTFEISDTQTVAGIFLSYL